jgi:hypothetical protein
VDKIQSYGAHAVAYVGSLLALVAGLDPTMFAGHPKIIATIGAAGLILTAAHNVNAAGTPKPGSVSTVAKVLALFVVSVLTVSSLVACKTAPTAKEQSAVTVAVYVVAGRAIRDNDSVPAVWKARAEKYKAAAIRLRDVNEAGTATLATLTAELEPLIAKLNPDEQLAARALVAGLTPYLQEQINASETVAVSQERLSYILAALITVCEAYGA